MSPAAPRAPKFFNTLGRRAEPFQPVVAGEARMYTCGPTVYNHVHIGNLRTFVFEDLLRRSLRYLGYRVTQVMNLTDVDDKTIRGAEQAGVPLAVFTAPFVDSFFADLATLQVEPAEHYPRATAHVAEMIAIIERLLAKGFAYESDGSIWFRISQDTDYGRLSGVARADDDAARRGERVQNDEYEKEDVRDFVLWKGAKPGEPIWDSPWGPGRPGWHIECSAMSAKYLGNTFDLHCGAVDNMFPHHENEIAQSESANDVLYVTTWLHAEHLIVDGEKMSKSLGNQYTLQDLLARGVRPRALRFLFLSVHYRQKLNFTFAALDNAAAALRRLDELRFRVDHASEGASESLAVATASLRLAEDFAAALADDLNVSEAWAAVFQFVKAANIAIESGLGLGDRARIVAALADVDRVLGVVDPAPWGEARVSADADAEIVSLVAERDAARARRDFAAADRLRQALAERGITIEDTPQGARWKRG
jgi:cysteinyl-tRNA synthetase